MIPSQGDGGGGGRRDPGGTDRSETEVEESRSRDTERGEDREFSYDQ